MLVIDVEATGINFVKNSIVSIGAIDFFNPTNTFYEECQIFEGAEINPEGIKVCGFTEQQVKDPTKKTIEIIMKEFFDWTAKIKFKTLAGQNTSFDRDYLKISAERSHLERPFGYRTIDVHSICYAHYLIRGKTPPYENGFNSLNLDKILNYVGIPAEPKPHNALTGAKSATEILSRLIYGKKLLNDFQEFPLPNYLINHMISN